MSSVFPAVKKTFLQMIGPSLIFVALSLSGGEMLLWPHLVSNYGFGILWPIPIILILQFTVNIEIERYTLITGKSAQESMASHSTWLAIIFAISILAALVWPAWITVAGNLIVLLFGFTGENTKHLGLIISIILLLGSLFIFYRPSTYKVLEKMSRIGLVLALGIILFVVILKFDAHKFLVGLEGLVNLGYIPKNLSRFAFVGALAYGGVAGVLNLVQGEWIRDKGYGINQEGSDLKSTNLDSPESVKNYRTWFAFINKEHFLLFVVANIISIFLLAYLGSLLVPTGSAEGFEVLRQEIKSLDAYIPYLGKLFALSGIVIFAMANITILDSIGRLIYRLLTPFRNRKASNSLEYLAQSSSSSISMIAVGIGILILLLSLVIPSFKQPFFLLVVSAVISAFTMWLYPPLLIKLNYTTLPKVSRPKLWRVFLLLVTTIFYGSVTLWALSEYLPMWIIVLAGAGISLYHIKVLYQTFRNA